MTDLHAGMRAETSRGEAYSSYGRKMALINNMCADPSLPHSELVVALIFNHHANRDTGLAWPGIQNIVKWTGKHETTIKRARRGLENKGIIVRVPPPPGRSGHRNYYQVNMDWQPNVRASAVPQESAATPDQGGTHAPTWGAQMPPEKERETNKNEKLIEKSGARYIPHLSKHNHRDAQQGEINWSGWEQHLIKDHGMPHGGTSFFLIEMLEVLEVSGFDQSGASVKLHKILGFARKNKVPDLPWYVRQEVASNVRRRGRS